MSKETIPGSGAYAPSFTSAGTNDLTEVFYEYYSREQLVREIIQRKEDRLKLVIEYTQELERKLASARISAIKECAEIAAKHRDFCKEEMKDPSKAKTANFIEGEILSLIEAEEGK